MPQPAYEKLGSFYLGRELDSKGKDTPELMLYDSRHLTTHAVCVGMTGSGKTGLCLALLEEAAIDGVPAIIIDPKGDLANLLLTFPQLRGEDFLPWVDTGEAARKNLSVADYAAATAATWKQGLADWQQDGARIERLKAAAEFAVYTPGNTAGRPLSMLRSFTPPDAALLNDSGALKERIGAAVAGLLGLLGIEADPLKSREHILVANLLEHSWRAGEAPDLPAIIQGIQKPPFDKVGVFDLETFYSAKDRLTLAMAINNLLAAPGFDAWLQGETLDAQRLLFTDAGKPRVSIISIAHLNDAERMFVVTLLLNEVVMWMRKQSGTSSLRALLYMDEIFGYFPPSAMPPSKIPLLTLMKQARAFGLGVVLATQNPVDLDYKGLSNAGTWFIGRLQTERDKARVIDGLLGAGNTGMDKSELEPLLANLSNRVFLMRSAHEDKPVLMKTRWAMSYLRGPLTLAELQKLNAASPQSAATGANSGSNSGSNFATKSAAGESQTAQASQTVRGARNPKPVIPAGINECYLRSSQADATTYVPYILGTTKSHYVDSTNGVDLWRTESRLAPLNDDGSAPDWSAAKTASSFKDQLDIKALAGLSYADGSSAVLRAVNYTAWSKQLAEHIYENDSFALLRCAFLKTSSNGIETESEFRARIALTLREKCDAEIDKLRQEYAPRVATLTDQIRRAQERTAREQAQLTQQKMQTAISVGTAILGAFLGRKAMSAANIGRAGTAIRSAGKIAKESSDVSNANESVEVLQQRLSELQGELEGETAKLQSELDPNVVSVATLTIKPRKSEITTTSIALVWVPI